MNTIDGKTCEKIGKSQNQIIKHVHMDILLLFETRKYKRHC